MFHVMVIPNRHGTLFLNYFLLLVAFSNEEKKVGSINIFEAVYSQSYLEELL